MHPIKMQIQTIPETSKSPCELPARTRNVIRCDYNADVEFQSTNGKHLISVCIGHLDSGFSYGYDQVLQRLGRAPSNIQIERGEISSSESLLKKPA